jgi:type IV fimbrial biogenesis protein FimT
MKTLKRGFTLIELAVTLAIVAILFAQAAPSFTAWIHNAQIRTAAESMQSGLQLARAEAIRRNRSVYFWLTSTATPPVADWLVACANPAGGGAVPEATGDCPGISQPSAVPANAAPINWIQRQAAAGQQTALPRISIPNNATEVTFGSLGLVVPNVDGTPSITEIDLSDPSISTARPLHVTISGGQIRMCDPGLSPSTDPRGC